MAQNQPKLTADWFAHRMSATHTLAAAVSKKRALQELKDQRALGGKNSYQSMSAWQQTALTSPWCSPTINLAKAGYRRTASLRTQAGAGKRTLPLLPPPVCNPGPIPPLPEAAELVGAEPGGGGGVRVGEGAAAAARYAQSAAMQESPPTTPLQRALSPRATCPANPNTFSATSPTRISRQTTAALPG